MRAKPLIAPHIKYLKPTEQILKRQKILLQQANRDQRTK
jgi:hypothetical protein